MFINYKLLCNSNYIASPKMVPLSTESYSSFTIYIFLPKLEIRTVCFENPKLNPNNLYS